VLLAVDSALHASFPSHRALFVDLLDACRQWREAEQERHYGKTAGPRPFLLLMAVASWAAQVVGPGRRCWLQVRGDDIYLRFPASNERTVPFVRELRLLDADGHAATFRLASVRPRFALGSLNAGYCFKAMGGLTVNRLLDATAIDLGVAGTRIDLSPAVRTACGVSTGERRALRQLLEAYLAGQPAAFSAVIETLYRQADLGQREPPSDLTDWMAQAMAAEIADATGGDREEMRRWGLQALRGLPWLEEDLAGKLPQ